MRISDWSSDGCSSDLSDAAAGATARHGPVPGRPGGPSRHRRRRAMVDAISGMAERLAGVPGLDLRFRVHEGETHISVGVTLSSGTAGEKAEENGAGGAAGLLVDGSGPAGSDSATTNGGQGSSYEGGATDEPSAGAVGWRGTRPTR